jgi:hypothetical protein
MGWVEGAEGFLNKHIRAIGIIIAICGISIRVCVASNSYLDPDEALHYTIAAFPWHGLVGFYFNTTYILHPPLLIALLQPVMFFGHSEVLLRLVPSVSGALFPWFVMLWVQRFAGNGAALIAQLLLTFSPALIDLSAEVRAYTLAFLFFSVSLLFLEKSLESGSNASMIWFNVFLCLAVLSEYAVAWFMAAAGIYAILRLWKRPASGRLFLVWALGQFVALALYLFLYITDVARLSHKALEGMYTTWLGAGFPQPHENLLRFAAHGTLQQFEYMFQLRELDWPCAIVFLLGVYWLWRRKSPLHAILMVLPFCFACLGAIFYLFPYGPSRHSAVLDIAIAATVGAGAAQFARNRLLPIAAVALPCVLIWIFLSTHSHEAVAGYLTMPRPDRQLRDMKAATAFLQKKVPDGALILTDYNTDRMLGYYLGCPAFGSIDWRMPYSNHDCGILHFAIYPSDQFESLADIQGGLAKVHATYGSERSVWIVSGGWGSRSSIANSVPAATLFGNALIIFQESDLRPQTSAHS